MEIKIKNVPVDFPVVYRRYDSEDKRSYREIWGNHIVRDGKHYIKSYIFGVVIDGVISRRSRCFPEKPRMIKVNKNTLIYIVEMGDK